MDRCQIRRCRAEADMAYLGRGVCERHWNTYTADDARPDRLREVLGIEAAPVAAMEEKMDASKQTPKTEAAEAAPAKTKAKPGKKASKAREPKEPRVRKGEAIEDACVFAFRLSVSDRSRIHEAAGPAGATRFVRSAALAAATGDQKAFEALVAQAKANLK